MSRSLILSFNSAVAKYSRLTRKVRKSISKGDFFRFTRRKRHHLLARIERLRRRLNELRTQIRFAGMGIAAAAILSATSAEAQKTTIGPFIENPLKNPIPPPAFLRTGMPQVSYIDTDNDGDLDAIVGDTNRELIYYINEGNKNVARFKQYDGSTTNPFPFSFPGPSPNNPARVTFADIDHDGDQDMVATVFASTYNNSDPDPILFFRNTGTDKEPLFVDDGTNPFTGVSVIQSGWPAFADTDGDGDQDLVISGYYNDDGSRAWMQFFRNDQTDNTPGVDPTFTQLTHADNPFYLTSPSYNYISISFADIDEDGDPDLIYAGNDAQIHYKRNDKGTFVEQEGPWTFNQQDPGSSTGNPFSGLSGWDSSDGYVSIAFGDLDGDGDLDATFASDFIDLTPQSTNYTYFINAGHGVFQLSAAASGGIDALDGISIGQNASSFFYDYDGDGDKDIISTSTTYQASDCEGAFCSTTTYSTLALVFLNDQGKYTPQEFSNSALPPLLPPFGTTKLSDIDGDGDLDLAIVIPDDPGNGRILGVTYYRNDGGEYVELKGSDNPFDFVSTLNRYQVHFDIADLDADGLPDLVMQETNEYPIAYKNTGTIDSPSYTTNDEWSKGLQGTSLFQDASPTLVDLDSDGDYDILLGKYAGGLYYYENQGDKTNPVFQVYVNTGEGAYASQWERNPLQDFRGSGLAVPDLADIDGDGDKDMLFVNSDTGTFGFFENQNPAPVITTVGPLTLDLTPNKAVTLDAEMTIADQDKDEIVKIVAAISPYDQGLEKLQVPAAASYPTLTFSWDDTKGILTVSGTTSVATDYQDVLQDIEYLYTGPDFGGRKAGGKKSNNGRTISKTITVTTLDSDLTIAPSNTTTFNIGHSNEPPVITPASFNAAYTSANVPVVPTIVLSDNDDANMVSAQVSFDVNSYKSAEDRLLVSVTGGITSNFDQAAGVLTLTGAGTIADYQTVLRSVMYSNQNGASGTSGIRVLNIKVNDGETDSNVGTTQLSVNGAVNSPPAISGGVVKPFYINGDLVINNTIVVTDPDGIISSATVAVTSNFVSTEDILLFDDQNGITGSYSSATGILTLNGSSSVANYQAALRTVRYRNASSTPTTDDRGITFTVTDGSTPASLTGTVITINKPPVIKTAQKKTAATDGNIAVPISAITDPDFNLDITTLVVTSELGDVTIADGIITIDYVKNGQKTNTDHVTITVCDTGGRCKTQNIDVELGALAVIYDGMSPNSDGINDWFYIENLPKNTHVVIYDRWGDPIFETSDYDMTDPSNRFEGKNKNGNDVVAGTYYYKIKFEDDKNGTKSGFIILNR